MKSKERIILSKMIKYCKDAIKYILNKTFEEFMSNELELTFSIFSLSQMGELSAKLDEEFKNEHSDIPWNALRSIRNRIVHDYEGVQYKVVWDTLINDIPNLIVQLEKIN